MERCGEGWGHTAGSLAFLVADGLTGPLCRCTTSLGVTRERGPCQDRESAS